MTSRRFPGKSMAELLGKPVLQHVIERCKLIKAPFGFRRPLVVVAMPDTPESEPMVELAAELGVGNSCGSEFNVLERYYNTARFFNFDYIVRVTADCPFIDPIVCSQVLNLLIWRKCDYVSNCHQDRTYPKGLDCEAFTMDCLEVAYIMVEQQHEEYTKLSRGPKLGNFKAMLNHLDYCREHVTPFMIDYPGLKRAIIKQKTNMSNLNWCIDYPEDIPRLEAEYDNIINKYKKASNDNTQEKVNE